MLEATDHLLTQRCRAGRREALAELLRQHRPLVCRLARHLVGNDGDVEDVVQDVLVAVVGGIRRFRGEARLTTWITSITVRTALRHAQSRRRRDERQSPLEATSSSQEARAVAGADPVAAVEARDFADHLRAAIAELPAPQRAVVVLRHVEGMELREIAQVLRTPVGTVKSRLHHARRALRRSMAPYLDGQREAGD